MTQNKEQSSSIGGLVRLNVGGTRFVTSRATLAAAGDSMLAKLVSDEWHKPSDGAADDELFVDRDPTCFPHILAYLRDGLRSMRLVDKKIEVLEQMAIEAEFYQLTELSNYLEKRLGPCPKFEEGDNVRWRPEAIDDYWRGFAYAMTGVCDHYNNRMMFFFVPDLNIRPSETNVRPYGTCIACGELSKITPAFYDEVSKLHVRFEDWTAVQRYMHATRGRIMKLEGFFNMRLICNLCSTCFDVQEFGLPQVDINSSPKTDRNSFRICSHNSQRFKLPLYAPFRRLVADWLAAGLR